jgi:preprotein translocase subunit YajC
LASLILLLAMFVLLWVLLIRPQRQRQQKQQNLLSSVEPGDEVLTVGGLYGIVRDIDEEDDLIVEIAEGISVRIARRAVGGVVKPDDEEDEIEDGDEDDEEVLETEMDTEIDEEGVAAHEDSVSEGLAEAAEGSDPR